MNIAEEVSFDKEGHVEGKLSWRRLFLALVIILVASLSFGIGRLSVVGKSEPIKIEYDPSLTSAAITSLPVSPTSKLQNLQTSVVGSKNGTKYHFEHCAGAKQIKEENKVVFSSPSVAEASGYTLAANCKP